MCTFRAGALSPYRLVTSIFAHLLALYAPGRLSLETHTPVLGIAYDKDGDPKYPYVVTTPRGMVRTSHVVHCTNGYAGHLVPGLRGPMYPFRGAMTAQNLDGRLPNRGNTQSWSIHRLPSYDAQSGRCAPGTYYLQQNPSSGYFYFGGGEATAANTVTHDDSVVLEHSTACLQEELVKLFGLEDQSKPGIVSSWTGIMGFTADGQPMVGRLPSTTTDRDGEGEWIAAGFNGMGMSMCVLSGEAVARMILGEPACGMIPEAFQVTPSRLQERLTTKRSVSQLSNMFPVS